MLYDIVNKYKAGDSSILFIVDDVTKIDSIDKIESYDVLTFGSINKNRLDKYNIVIFMMNESDIMNTEYIDGLIHLINGLHQKIVMLRIPRIKAKFDFDKFIKSINSDFIDVYNRHLPKNDKINQYYLVTKIK